MIIEVSENAYFMPNKGAIVDSLFMKKQATARGYYKKGKYVTEFYDHQDKLKAALIHIKHNEYFFVTALKLTNKRDKGKRYFMFGLDDIDKAFLGLGDCGYLEEKNTAERIAKQLLSN